MKGEFTFEADGRTLTMKLGFGALAKAQQHLGRLDFENVGPNEMVTMFWAGLQRKHPDIGWDEAGDILDELGGERAGEVLKGAMEAAGLLGGDGEAAERPRKAAA